VFPGPGSSEQGFYSDGLFTFSLFTMSRSTQVTGLDDPMAFVTDDGVYDMVPTAQDVRIYWSDTESNFVLVGDLPPDHAQAVLSELPLPDNGTMFQRWWQRLFG
jgi:negative regulator of sigma E activity